MFIQATPPYYLATKAFWSDYILEIQHAEGGGGSVKTKLFYSALFVEPNNMVLITFCETFFIMFVVEGDICD